MEDDYGAMGQSGQQVVEFWLMKKTLLLKKVEGLAPEANGWRAGAQGEVQPPSLTFQPIEARPLSTAVLDSLDVLRDGGTVCTSGMLSGEWVIDPDEQLQAEHEGFGAGTLAVCPAKLVARFGLTFGASR